MANSCKKAIYIYICICICQYYLNIQALDNFLFLPTATIKKMNKCGNLSKNKRLQHVLYVVSLRIYRKKRSPR